MALQCTGLGTQSLEWVVELGISIALEPIRRVARTIREHLWGIINAIVLKADNGRSEAMNRKIQQIKSRACGCRNRERFRNAIYFHLDGLDLYPAVVE